MVQPEPIPDGTLVRLKPQRRMRREGREEREGFVYILRGRFDLEDGSWVGDYRYMFCAEKQTDDFDPFRPPEGSFEVLGRMVEPV